MVCVDILTTITQGGLYLSHTLEIDTLAFLFCFLSVSSVTHVLSSLHSFLSVLPLSYPLLGLGFVLVLCNLPKTSLSSALAN